MNISHRYALAKMCLNSDMKSLPPLLRGLRGIPVLILICWSGVVALQVFSVEETGGGSLVSLLIFIILTSLVIPVLTYISAYAASSSLIQGLVSKGKISKWMAFVSKASLSVLAISFFCMIFSIPYFGSYLLPPVFFVFLMAASWVKFRKEIKVLASARDFLMLKQNNMHFSQGAMLNNEDAFDINPANGLPMLNSAIDMLGNPRGVDASVFPTSEAEALHTAVYAPEYTNVSINPSTGLPMIDSTFDIQGNTWGSTGDSYHESR